MKKSYLNPEWLVIELEEKDIVTLSGSEMPMDTAPAGDDREDWDDYL